MYKQEINQFGLNVKTVIAPRMFRNYLNTTFHGYEEGCKNHFNLIFEGLTVEISISVVLIFRKA